MSFDPDPGFLCRLDPDPPFFLLNLTSEFASFDFWKGKEELKYFDISKLFFFCSHLSNAHYRSELQEKFRQAITPSIGLANFVIVLAFIHILLVLETFFFHIAFIWAIFALFFDRIREKKTNWSEINPLFNF